MNELVLGTTNPHKVKEFKQLLQQNYFTLIGLGEAGSPIAIEETGKSFEENARLKATIQSKHLNRWVLAEDSGLTVAALDGRPGVFSARYSGQHGDDLSNNRKLLHELGDSPLKSRSAAFECHICVSTPEGIPAIEVSGTCQGIIGFAEAGKDGFGYDPLFFIPEYHKTFSELGSRIKNTISHRSIAVRKLLPRLTTLNFI